MISGSMTRECLAYIVSQQTHAFYPAIDTKHWVYNSSIETEATEAWFHQVTPCILYQVDFADEQLFQ